MTRAAFADPVLQSQATFRAVLRAMSRPGTLVASGEGLTPPQGLEPAAAAALLTLADYETPLWFAPSLAGTPAADWLIFHTGAPIARDPAQAAFALIDLRRDAFIPADFGSGTAAYPDRSTTLILACDELSSQKPWTLAGPGIPGFARFGFFPSPDNFLNAWRANGARYPLGVDLIVTAGGQLAALPRTTRIEETA